MRKVFKTELPVTNVPYKLRVDTSFNPVHIGLQNGVPHMWYEVDTAATAELLYIEMFGTGWEISDEELLPISSVILPSGFVAHYYGKFIDE